MDYAFIESPPQLQELCQRLRDCGRICFDTEFVSEFTYRPDLCLVQVEADGHLAIIDTHAVTDLEPFWRQLVEGDHATIVHAGREELRFCLASTGKVPQHWFDVQIAAGFAGYEFPISYSKIIQKLVGTTLPKGETRTDWRKRPLTPSQLEYALMDVVHLPELQTTLLQQLDALQRLPWMEDETTRWIDNLLESESSEKWRKLSGASRVPLREQPILRELWRWRESVAQERNCPPRRVLRDDLIIELVRRGKSDPKHIRAIRGLHRRDLESQYPMISDAIEKGKATPPEARGRDPRRDYPEQITLLGQFLGTALASICRRQSIATSLVGTVQDVRDLTAYELGYGHPDEPPSLMQGWRAEIVGDRFRELLGGSLALRIADPLGDAPLVFEAVQHPPQQ